MSEPVSRANRPLLLKLAVVGTGPLAFFTSMAVLPLFGAPLSPFSLTVGSAFGPTLGMPLVIVFALTALTFNIMLSYYLACRAFRPLLEKLVVRRWLGR